MGQDLRGLGDLQRAWANLIACDGTWPTYHLGDTRKSVNTIQQQPSQELDIMEPDKAKLLSQDAEVGSGFWEFFGFQIFDQSLDIEHNSIDHVLGF